MVVVTSLLLSVIPPSWQLWHTTRTTTSTAWMFLMMMMMTTVLLLLVGLVSGFQPVPIPIPTTASRCVSPSSSCTRSSFFFSSSSATSSTSTAWSLVPVSLSSSGNGDNGDDGSMDMNYDDNNCNNNNGDDNNNHNNLFFDDFDGQEIGGDSTTTNFSNDDDGSVEEQVGEEDEENTNNWYYNSYGGGDNTGDDIVDDELLRARIRSLEATEQEQRLILNDNWKEGYWGVHAFSLEGTLVTMTATIDDQLDDDDDDETGKTTTTTFITCMMKIQITETGYDEDDIAEGHHDDYDDDDDNDSLLVVGRSDGSLIGLRFDPTGSSTAPVVVDSTARTASSLSGSSSNLQNHFNLAGYWKPTTRGFDIGSVLDMLYLPKSKSLWTIGSNKESSIISHQLIIVDDQDSDDVFSTASGSIFGSSSHTSSPSVIETPHTSPIISMMNIDSPSLSDHNTDIVVTVSSNGQIVIWNIHDDDVTGQQQSVVVATVVAQCHLFGEGEDNDCEDDGGLLSPEERLDSNNDRILCADIITDRNESHNSHRQSLLLILGSQIGKIYALNIQYYATDGSIPGTEETTPPDITFMSSWMAFPNGSNNGVSTVRITEDGAGTTNSPTSKTPSSKLLLAGNLQGEIKQWQLIASSESSSSSSSMSSSYSDTITTGSTTTSTTSTTTNYQHWPRMSSQRMKDKAHVFDTKVGRSRGSMGGGMFGTFDTTNSEDVGAVRSILYLKKQQVVIAATDDGDLTVYDPSTGQVLYSMDGSFDFRSSQACLVAATSSMLLTNGMGNYICVHDYAMERLDDDNIEDFFDVFSSE